AADLAQMPAAEAKAIYKAQYWDALRCDLMPGGVDYAVFDYGVNSGVARAGRVLRRVAGLNDGSSSVTADVLAALAREDAAGIIVAVCDERLRFLQGLKTWP